MLILALETSSQAGSVALLACSAASDTVLSQRVLPTDRRSAQTLAPAIAQVLAEAGRAPAEVRLVAVTVGPGSFTGLRVGVTTAKTFAYAVGCECLGIDTLEVIAWQASKPRPLVGVRSSEKVAPEKGLYTSSESKIEAALDAQRKELFVARFSANGRDVKRIAENRIVPADEWLQELAPGTIVTGAGINRLLDRLPPEVIAADVSLREPQAVTVGRLAWEQYQRGRRDDLWKLAPKYLRASAAEEKAAKGSAAAPPTK